MSNKTKPDERKGRKQSEGHTSSRTKKKLGSLSKTSSKGHKGRRDKNQDNGDDFTVDGMRKTPPDSPVASPSPSPSISPDTNFIPPFAPFSNQDHNPARDYPPFNPDTFYKASSEARDNNDKASNYRSKAPPPINVPNAGSGIKENTDTYQKTPINEQADPFNVDDPNYWGRRGSVEKTPPLSPHSSPIMDSLAFDGNDLPTSYFVPIGSSPGESIVSYPDFVGLQTMIPNSSPTTKRRKHTTKQKIRKNSKKSNIKTSKDSEDTKKGNSSPHLEEPKERKEREKKSHDSPKHTPKDSNPTQEDLQTHLLKLAMPQEDDGPPFKWTKGALIARSSCGAVYQGLTDSGAIVAIKLLDLPPNIDELTQRQIVSFRKEITFFKQFNHQNIVRYFGYQQDKNAIYIFLEYVACGSLSSIIHKFGGSINENLMKKYSREILNGLDYLHSQKVIHRDIKGANILVDASGVAKLADFGCAKMIEGIVTSEVFRSMQGTACFMAPEVLKQEGHGRSADIWSFGCTLIEMATGHPPYYEYKDNVAALIFNILVNGKRPDIPKNVSQEAQDFIAACLTIDREKRPKVQELLTHPWLSEPT